MSYLWRLVVVGACIGFVPSSATAFWSLVTLGVRSPSAAHQQFTSAAIGAPATFTFGGRTSSSSGEPYSFSSRAIDQINEGHTLADNPLDYHAEDHFDSDKLLGSLNQIAKTREELRKALTPPISAVSQEKAWILLGLMLHAAQDFYSHSSWIELTQYSPLPPLAPFPEIIGFGAYTKTFPATIPQFFLASASSAACVRPDGYPLLEPVNQLTTGYYAPLIAAAGRCEHGSLSHAVETCLRPVPVQGISKDSPCASYPLGPSHFTAADLAIKETRDFLQSVVKDLDTGSNTQGFCALLDLPPSASICSYPTRTVLMANPATLPGNGGSATLTAQVSSPTAPVNAATLTGTVTFADQSGFTLCSRAAVTNGVATCTAQIPQAPNRVSANYTGDLNYLTSFGNTTIARTPLVVSVTGPEQMVVAAGVPIGPFQPLTASGGAPPHTYYTNYPLPAGLRLDPVTGTVSGTPTAAARPVSDVVFNVFDATGTSPTSSTVKFTVTGTLTGTWVGTVTDYGNGRTYGATVTLAFQGYPCSQVCGTIQFFDSNGLWYNGSTYGYWDEAASQVTLYFDTILVLTATMSSSGLSGTAVRRPGFQDEGAPVFEFSLTKQGL